MFFPLAGACYVEIPLHANYELQINPNAESSSADSGKDCAK
jgi:hypothetical protein